MKIVHTELGNFHVCTKKLGKIYSQNTKIIKKIHSVTENSSKFSPAARQIFRFIGKPSILPRAAKK